MQINQRVYITHYQISEFSLSGRLLLYLFVDMHCTCALFAHRAAGIPLQAHKLLCPDGECCSHSDPGPWCPASSDPAWPAHTGRKTLVHRRAWTNGVSLGLNNSSARTAHIQTNLSASLFS